MGSLRLPGHAQSVAVADGIAYVEVDGEDPPYSLRLIDLSNPAAPIALGAIDVPGPIAEIRVSGGLAFVAVNAWTRAGRRGSIRVIDVSDRSGPFELGAFELGNGVDDAEIVGDRIFASGGSYGLKSVVFGPEYVPSVLRAEIEIETSRGGKGIGLGGSSSVGVAVLGSEPLDVRRIDEGSLRFGRGSSPVVGPIAFEDVNQDGRVDAVARFSRRAARLGSENSVACVAGQLHGGVLFRGCDTIQRSRP
jgi:hypothetical protein